MLGHNSTSSNPSSEPFTCLESGNNSKRKRRPAGTPDPDAEVVSLSPKTLLESDRYVCEICNQGFQRDQNLQMHRRRHKVPWKLLKRETPGVRKRVFVCPEPSCLHHDPCHALGDLVGIKKHFRRKHSNHKQWVCEKCSKGYAVQSDYKAHLKTCGTRGHSCDCGRVFSRVESFIEHQDACNLGRFRHESKATTTTNTTLHQPACLSRTASSRSPSSDINFSTAARAWPATLILPAKPTDTIFLSAETDLNYTPHHHPSKISQHHNLELQLLTTSSSNYPVDLVLSAKVDDNQHQLNSTHLQLSIGSSDFSESSVRKSRKDVSCRSFSRERNVGGEGHALAASRLKEQAREQLRMAMAQKAYAEEARKQAKQQIELADKEFANAQRIRQQAQAELDKARALKEHAMKQINTTILQITCHSCKQQFQARTTTTTVTAPPPLLPSDEHSLVLSYNVSSAVTEGEMENDVPNENTKKSLTP
ncbi:Zinc finger C2H2-type [Dillenia turbinata]|uniref:Zinc finger C2H2-type n=1 Tax=Dillenia turbinata TaxID=194707 RepID=A0AAN8Z5B2_9MAGN